MTRYRKSLALFVSFVIVFELCVILVGNAIRPEWTHWGDEWHFQNSIKKFGAEISVDTLTHYEEMSTPLPFVLYALWGRMFGFDLFHLRIFSLLTAFVAYLLFHRLLFVAVKRETAVFWGSAFLVVQPYLVGFSIFIYTDMLAILFLILTVLAAVRQRPVLLATAMALALLSRQYIAFLTLALGIYHLSEYVSQRKKSTLKMLMALLVSIVPYGLLVLLWGGASPDNSLRLRYLDEGFYFHPSVFSLYVGLIFVYLFPMVIYRAREFYGKWHAWALAIVGAAYYWLFPVGPTKPSIAVGTMTVGLFHRALKFVWDNEWFVQAVFLLAFVLALPVVFYIVRSLYDRLRTSRFDTALAMDLAVVSFLIVTPFSYLGWEKYFMPAVPLIILRVLLIDSRSRTDTG